MGQGFLFLPPGQYHFLGLPEVKQEARSRWGWDGNGAWGRIGLVTVAIYVPTIPLSCLS